MDHKELLERYWELQELFFAPKKNSKNSSKSPSSDENKSEAKKNQSLRKKSEKQTWWQIWHKGSTKRHEKADETIEHKKSNCSKCDASLEWKTWKTVEIRQEFDIPPIVPYVTQHERQSTTCNCWCEVTGEFPSHIKWYTQRGPNVASIITYLNIRHKLPYKRLSEIVKDLIWLKISQGSIDNLLKKMWEKSEKKHAEIMVWLQASEYVWTDETGNHVNGKKWRVWTRQNDLYVYLCLEMSRWYKVVQGHFWETFEGILWHDCWSAHNNTNAWGHQLCLAHLHRDLNYVIEKDGSQRSYQMRDLILKGQRAKKRWLKWEIEDDRWEKVKMRYERKTSALCDWVSSWYKDTMRMIKRFRKHSDKIWMFMKYKRVPPHNNQSEQVIRNQKIHKKVSWWFRSLQWWKRHCVILSVIETSRRHGMDVLESLNLLYIDQLLRVRPE